MTSTPFSLLTASFCFSFFLFNLDKGRGYGQDSNWRVPWPKVKPTFSLSAHDWQTIIVEGARAAPTGRHCRLLDAVSWRQCILGKKKKEKTESGDELSLTQRDRVRERPGGGGGCPESAAVPADELEEGHCNWYLHCGSINNTSSTISWPCCDFEERANKRCMEKYS